MLFWIITPYLSCLNSSWFTQTQKMLPHFKKTHYEPVTNHCSNFGSQIFGRILWINVKYYSTLHELYCQESLRNFTSMAYKSTVKHCQFRLKTVRLFSAPGWFCSSGGRRRSLLIKVFKMWHYHLLTLPADAFQHQVALVILK